MARPGLILCALDDRKITAIQDKILARAAELRDQAYRAPLDVIQRKLTAARELEWAAALLLGEATPSVAERPEPHVGQHDDCGKCGTACW